MVSINGNGGNKPRPDKQEDGPNDKTRRKGDAKGKMRHKKGQRRFGFNATS
jgi:hypothetical protein